MAGHGDSSDFTGRIDRNPAVASADGHGGSSNAANHQVNPNGAADPDGNAGDGGDYSSTDLGTLDPYVRMVLGEALDLVSALNGHDGLASPREGSFHDLPRSVSFNDSIGSVLGWTEEYPKTNGAPFFDDRQMGFPGLPQISYFTNVTAAVRGDDGRAGSTSFSGHDLLHGLKREEPADAAGMGVRIGASSNQRNVRQRFSNENQQDFAPPPNPNLFQILNDDPLFLFPFHRSSGNIAPGMHDPSSSRATTVPTYPQVDGAEIWRPLAPIQTHLNPNYVIHGSNASGSSSSLSENYAEAYLPMLRRNLLQLGAGPSSNQALDMMNDLFGPVTSPTQDGGFLFTPRDLNISGEPLTVASLLRRSSNIQAPGQDVLVGSRFHQASSGSAPAHLAPPILVPTPSLSNAAVHISEPPFPSSFPILPPPTWLAPAFLPLRAATNREPAYLAPASHSARVNWREDDFLEDDEEEEDEEFDGHEDMRFDVDNMSYEQLLEMEDNIGSVSTGVSKDVIKALLKSKKYRRFKIGPSVEEDICCICQENYKEGQLMGILHCGHKFHFKCIKKWLVRKNLCPICKQVAL